MFGFAVEVLFRLLLETAVALGPSVEVIVLTITAHPATVREVEFFLLLLHILLGLGLGILPKDRWLVLLSTCLELGIFFITLLSGYTFHFFLDGFRRRIFFQK
jgi:hypothetical protein